MQAIILLDSVGSVVLVVLGAVESSSSSSSGCCGCCWRVMRTVSSFRVVLPGSTNLEEEDPLLPLLLGDMMELVMLRSVY